MVRTRSAASSSWRPTTASTVSDGPIRLASAGAAPTMTESPMAVVGTYTGGAARRRAAARSWSWCAGIRVPARRPGRRGGGDRRRGRGLAGPDHDGLGSVAAGGDAVTTSRVTPTVPVNTSEPTTRMPSATAGPAGRRVDQPPVDGVAGRSAKPRTRTGCSIHRYDSAASPRIERHLDRHPERVLGLLPGGVGQEHDHGPVDQVDAVGALAHPPQRAGDSRRAVTVGAGYTTTASSARVASSDDGEADPERRGSALVT